MRNDLLLIARVFTAAVAGFMILAGTFAAVEINAIIHATLLLFGIGISTLIALGVMLLLLSLGGRFFRLF